MFEFAVGTYPRVEVFRIVLEVLRRVIACVTEMRWRSDDQGREGRLPSQLPDETLRSLRTSEEERYCRTLSVAPLRIIVWRTINALKTTYGELIPRDARSLTSYLQ